MVDTSSSLVEKLYCVLPNRSIPSWQAIAQYANPHGLISSLGSYGWTTYAGRICGRAEKLGGRNGSRNLSRRRTFAAGGIHHHNYVVIDLPALYGGIRKGGCCHIGGVYLRVRSPGSRGPVHVVT